LSAKNGVIVPEKIMSVCKEDAIRKGYALKSYGEVVIADRIITPDVEFDRQQKNSLDELTSLIMESFSTAPREEINSAWLDGIINKYHHPDRKVCRKRGPYKKQKSIYDFAEEYLAKKRFSQSHEKAFRVLVRDWARYETFKNMVLHEKFKWNVDTITRSDIEDFEDYLRNEGTLVEQYPKQFEIILEKYPIEINVKHVFTKVKNRGDNTIVKLKKKFKAFMQWLYETERITNRPFDGIKIGTEKYGTPYYLMKEERNAIAEADLHEKWEKLSDEDKNGIPESSLKSLSVQRDIFVFQCLVGCRVSDLELLTKANITDGILEYVPMKTRGEDAPVKPRVPLNKKACELVKKYEGVDKLGRLFPFISSQKYNVAIKKILLICGITRNVQVRNSRTGETEIKRICDVASSHMARRTFVGAAYKAVRDPNIVGKMSGHVEGSRAFNRYRQIDDDILRETINEI
jgi:integrase